MNKYLKALIDYVRENPNYEKDLKKAPYNLKTIQTCPWNPDWKMFVYNLFESDLSNSIVRACRGTVLSVHGNDVRIISAPYTKFCNYGDPSAKDIEDAINWKEAKVQLKQDGILIKTAKVGDKLYFFTNGSFCLNAPCGTIGIADIPEPATDGMSTFGELLAYALLKEHNDIDVHYNIETGEFYITGGWSENVPEGSTLMMELVSPKNKIICDYPETKLYWHGYRTQYPYLNEVDPRDLKKHNFLNINYECPKIYDLHNPKEILEFTKSFDGNFQEGVVVVDYTNEECPRTKIKCEDYLRLKFEREGALTDRDLFAAVVNSEQDDLKVSAPQYIPKIAEMEEQLSEFYKDLEINKALFNKFTFDRVAYIKYAKQFEDPEYMKIIGGIDKFSSTNVAFWGIKRKGYKDNFLKHYNFGKKLVEAYKLILNKA